MRRAIFFFALPTLLFGCDETSSTNPDASVVAHADAFVPPPSPKILLFEAAATAVPRGETVELHWKVENAQRITIFSPTEILVDTDEAEGVVTTLAIQRRSSFDIRAAGYGTVGETLDVDAIWPEPVINELIAMPETTYVNGFVTLTWKTENAEKVSVYANDVLVPFSVFMGTAAASGQQFISITTEMTTLQLKAENPTYTITRDLELIAGPAPSIVSFRATPRTFVGTSTIVTISWDTIGFESTNLSNNFVPMENFSRATSGTTTIEVTQTTNFTLYGNYGGTPITQGDAIVGLAARELEPNDSPTQAYPIGYEGGVEASIGNLNDVDYYYVDVFSFTGPGALRLWTRGVGPGCPVDTIIEIYDLATNTLLGSDEDDGIPTGRGGNCAEINPTRDLFAQNLQGTYLVAVRGQRGETGDYVLFTELPPPRMGR